MQKSLFIVVLFFCFLACKTNWSVREVHMHNIPNNENISHADSAVLYLIAPYKTALEADMQKIIGISTADLVKGKPESPLTNYLSDLLLAEGLHYASTHLQASTVDLAYLNYGGIRNGLPKGEITISNLFELMPFENELVLLQIRGSDLLEFASCVAANGGDCVAGIKLGIKDEKASRFEINGMPVNPNKLYWIATSDYVAQGGDNMSMFLNREKYIQTGIKIRDCLIDHIRKEYQEGKTISPQSDGRIYYE